MGRNVLISRKTSFYNADKMIIGNNVRIDDFSILSGNIELGDYIHIAANCALFGGNEGISLHINTVAAEESIFENRVVHGALISSLISTVLGTKLPGEGTIYLSQESQFVKPVYFGDTITATVTMNSFEKKNRATLNTECFNQKGELVLRGKATVILPGI